MTDFDDLMMDLTFEHEFPTWELLQEALRRFPNQQRDVLGYFESWVWLDWIDAHAPQREPTPEEEAETQRWAEEATQRFLKRLDDERNSRVLN